MKRAFVPRPGPLRRALALCLLLLALGLTACGGGEVAEQPPFVVHTGETVRTLDPASGQGDTLYNHLYEGLTRLDESGQVALPGMAQRWTVSEDGLTYTFQLRRAKWSDGQAVTAQDFVYAWRRAAGQVEPLESPFLLLENGAKVVAGKAEPETLGVEALSARKLQVRLAQPNPLFPQICALPSLFPLREDWDAEREEGYSPTNGPYVLAEWTPGERALLVQSDRYHGRKELTLSSIEFLMGRDAQTALAEFQAGVLDFNAALPEDQLADLAKTASYRDFPALGSAYVCFHCTQEPLDDAGVRRALTLAVDRQALVGQLGRRACEPVAGLMGNGYWGGEQGFRTAGGNLLCADGKLDKSLSQAKKLLQQAGYGEDKPFPTITYCYNATTLNKVAAQALQQMWRDHLGVDVALESMEWSAFAAARSKDEFQLCRQALGAAYPDPLLVLQRFTGGHAANDANFDNQQYDSLVAKAAEEPELAARMELLHQAEELLLEQGGVAPLYGYVTPCLTDPQLQGLACDGRGIWFFGAITRPAPSPSPSAPADGANNQ